MSSEQWFSPLVVHQNHLGTLKDTELDTTHRNSDFMDLGHALGIRISGKPLSDSVHKIRGPLRGPTGVN
jgi:hypothetical protein